MRAQRSPDAYACPFWPVASYVATERLESAAAQLQEFTAVTAEEAQPAYEACACKLAIIGQGDAAAGRVSGPVALPSFCADPRSTKPLDLSNVEQFLQPK